MLRLLFLPFYAKLISRMFILMARLSPFLLKASLSKGSLSAQGSLRLKLEEVLYQNEILKFANRLLQQKLLETTKRPRFDLKEKLSLAFVSLLPLKNPSFLKEIFPVKWSTIKNWVYALQRGRIETLLPLSRRPNNSPEKTPDEIEALVCRIKRENPCWGYERIAGELRCLGILIHRSTVRRILIRLGLVPPTLKGCLTWMTIITHKPHEMWAMDVFRTRLWGLIPLYLCLILDDYSRVIIGFSVSFFPLMRWAVNCLRKAIERYGRPLSILTDNGSCFRSAFDTYLVSLGITHKRCAVGHPQSNGKVERLWRSVKSELLNRVPLLSREHLSWLMAEYIAYYNSRRPHQGIENIPPLKKLEGKDKIVPLSINGMMITRKRFAGGLLNSYELKKAA